MSEDFFTDYKDGDIVWVKLGPSWWPGEVKDLSSIPSEEIEFKKLPLAVVKFFEEDTYEYVRNWANIFPYNCEKKAEFIKKGMAAFRSKAPHMEKFPKDVTTAEVKLGGNPNILSEPGYRVEKKRNYAAEIFGSPSPKKGSKDSHKKLRPSNKNSPRDTSHITHRRFLGLDDYKAYICIQYPGKDRIPGDSEDEEVIRINTESEKEYNCHSCPYTTKRLEVMFLHTKSHIQGVYVSSPRRKRPVIARPRKKEYSKKRVATYSGNSSSEDIPEPPKEKKRKTKAASTPKKTSTKVVEEVKPKPPIDIRNDLLAEWEDTDDDLDNSLFDDSSKLYETLDTTDTTKLDESIDSIDKNPIMETDQSEKGNVSEIESEPSFSKILAESSGTKPESDNSVTNVESTDSVIKVGRLRSSKSIDKKETNSKPEMDKETQEAIKSCFDFDEEEEDDQSLINTTVAVGRKIPRVIPPTEKRKSEILDDIIDLEEEGINKDEILKVSQSFNDKANDKDKEELESAFKDLMETTSVPKLPEVDNTLKPTQNFHCVKTIKFPDKPDTSPKKEREKSTTEIPLNPKKRFVKSFEDFENQLQEENRRKKEAEELKKKEEALKKSEVEKFANQNVEDKLTKLTESDSGNQGFEQQEGTARRQKSDLNVVEKREEKLSNSSPRIEEKMKIECSSDEEASRIDLTKLQKTILTKILEEAKIADESKNKIMVKMKKKQTPPRTIYPNKDEIEASPMPERRSLRSTSHEIPKLEKANELSKHKLKSTFNHDDAKKTSVPFKKGRWSRRASYPLKNTDLPKDDKFQPHINENVSSPVKVDKNFALECNKDEIQTKMDTDVGLSLSQNKILDSSETEVVKNNEILVDIHQREIDILQNNEFSVRHSDDCTRNDVHIESSQIETELPEDKGVPQQLFKTNEPILKHAEVSEDVQNAGTEVSDKSFLAETLECIGNDLTGNIVSVQNVMTEEPQKEIHSDMNLPKSFIENSVEENTQVQTSSLATSVEDANIEPQSITDDISSVKGDIDRNIPCNQSEENVEYNKENSEEIEMVNKMSIVDSEIINTKQTSDRDLTRISVQTAEEMSDEGTEIAEDSTCDSATKPHKRKKGRRKSSRFSSRKRRKHNKESKVTIESDNIEHTIDAGISANSSQKPLHLPENNEVSLPEHSNTSISDDHTFPTVDKTSAALTLPIIGDVEESKTLNEVVSEESIHEATITDVETVEEKTIYEVPAEEASRKSRIESDSETNEFNQSTKIHEENEENNMNDEFVAALNQPIIKKDTVTDVLSSNKAQSELEGDIRKEHIATDELVTGRDHIVYDEHVADAEQVLAGRHRLTDESIANDDDQCETDQHLATNEKIASDDGHLTKDEQRVNDQDIASDQQLLNEQPVINNPILDEEHIARDQHITENEHITKDQKEQFVSDNQIVSNQQIACENQDIDVESEQQVTKDEQDMSTNLIIGDVSSDECIEKPIVSDDHVVIEENIAREEHTINVQHAITKNIESDADKMFTTDELVEIESEIKSQTEITEERVSEEHAESVTYSNVHSMATQLPIELPLETADKIISAQDMDEHQNIFQIHEEVAEKSVAEEITPEQHSVNEFKTDETKQIVLDKYANESYVEKQIIDQKHISEQEHCVTESHVEKQIIDPELIREQEHRVIESHVEKQIIDQELIPEQEHRVTESLVETQIIDQELIPEQEHRVTKSHVDKQIIDQELIPEQEHRVTESHVEEEIGDQEQATVIGHQTDTETEMLTEIISEMNDKNELEIEADKEIVSEETAKEIVPEETDKEIVSEETDKEIVFEETDKEIVFEETDKEIVSEETDTEIVSEETDKEIVSEETDKEIVFEETDKEIVSEETDKEIVSEETDKKIVSEEIDKEIVSEEIDKEVFFEETDKEFVSEETDKEIVSEETDKVIVPEETNKEIISEETDNEVVFEETDKEFVSEETDKDLVSEETDKEIVSEETDKEIVSEETKKEIVSEEIDKEVVFQENDKEFVSQETDKEIVSEETDKEIVSEDTDEEIASGDDKEVVSKEVDKEIVSEEVDKEIVSEEVDKEIVSEERVHGEQTDPDTPYVSNDREIEFPLAIEKDDNEYVIEDNGFKNYETVEKKIKSPYNVAEEYFQQIDNAEKTKNETFGEMFAKDNNLDIPLETVEDRDNTVNQDKESPCQDNAKEEIPKTELEEHFLVSKNKIHPTVDSETEEHKPGTPVSTEETFLKNQYFDNERKFINESPFFSEQIFSRKFSEIEEHPAQEAESEKNIAKDHKQEEFKTTEEVETETFSASNDHSVTKTDKKIERFSSENKIDSFKFPDFNDNTGNINQGSTENIDKLPNKFETKIDHKKSITFTDPMDDEDEKFTDLVSDIVQKLSEDDSEKGQEDLEIETPTAIESPKEQSNQMQDNTPSTSSDSSNDLLKDVGKNRNKPEDDPEHSKEVEVLCSGNSEDSFKFSIQTNLSNLSRSEEISAIALATLSEIKTDLECSDTSSNTSAEIAPKSDLNFPEKLSDNEMVAIEGNLTVMSEKDLADAQVEITTEKVISSKKPVMFSNFSMDFSDSTSDSGSLTEASNEATKFVDFDSKGTEFTSRAITKELKPKTTAKKVNAYDQCELLDILEGKSDLEKKIVEFQAPAKAFADDIMDFEECIPSQIVCTKQFRQDMDDELKKKDKKCSVISTTSKLLERLTDNKSLESKTEITSDIPVKAIKHPRPKPKPVILSEQIIKPGVSEAKKAAPASNNAVEDIEDVEAFVIHKDLRKTVEVEEKPKEVPAKPVRKPRAKQMGKAKILQQTIITAAGEILQPTGLPKKKSILGAPASVSQTRISTEAASTVITNNKLKSPTTTASPVKADTTNQDDNIFDIFNMPIVLSDQILTPESIENMPIVIDSATSVSKPTPKILTTPTPKLPVTKVVTKVMTTTASTLITTKTPVLTQKPRILQTLTAKTSLSSSVSPSIAKPGKYILVSQSSAGLPTQPKFPTKKTVMKRTSLPSLAASPQELTGNKIMVVTNQQGQQQRLLLTPAQQKVLGYQTPSGPKLAKAVVKTSVLPKNLLTPLSKAEAGSSKTPAILGQKVIVTTPSQVLTSTATSKITKTLPKGRVPSVVQKVVTSGKTSKTILITNKHGQTIKKIATTEDDIDKQVAEQLEAIKASSGMHFGAQPKPDTPNNKAIPNKTPIRRAAMKKQEPKPKSSPLLARSETLTNPPPLITTSKKPVPAVNEPKKIVQEEPKPQRDRPLNQLVIQDALGNQTTITEGQILALPSETVDGQPQSYMLVTLDQSGNLTPLNNEALMSLDPNLGLGGDLSNMVLQIDQGSVGTGNVDQPMPLAQPATVKLSNPGEELQAGTSKIDIPRASAPLALPVANDIASIEQKVQHQLLPPPSEASVNLESIVSNSNGEQGQQLIVTGDPIATQKFLESLTEGTTDLANIIANAEGKSILIQANGQQILINTNSDNQMLSNLPESTESGGNPIFATQPNKNTDILAAALADTDVFTSQPKISSQLSPNNALYPMNVGNVLETSLTLNSPIMTPLEVPSTNNKKIPDEVDILTHVPKNVDLPITITDPNISQTANQQVATLMASELHTNLELSLGISETTIPTGSTGLTSPGYSYSFPALDDNDMSHKPFNSSMPLLNDDEVVSPRLGNKSQDKEDDKAEDSLASERFLEEESRFTLGGGMCSSLSEPPPEMFDIPDVNSFGEKNGNNIPLSLQSTPDPRDDDTTDLSIQAESSSEGSCEIPLQPKIVAKSVDLSEM